MKLQTTELARIVEEVWDLVLGLGATCADPVDFPADQRVLTAAVHITGDWEGVVLLETPMALATHITGVMFGLDAADAGEDEVRDAVGELANMVGGNVKALVGGHCTLSLPSVTDGRGYEVIVPGSRLLERLSFESEGHVFDAALLERAAGKEGSS